MPGWETYLIEISMNRPFKQGQDGNRALSRLWETNMHFLGPNIKYDQNQPIFISKLHLGTTSIDTKFQLSTSTTQS